jgi:hypothetical protein
LLALVQAVGYVFPDAERVKQSRALEHHANAPPGDREFGRSHRFDVGTLKAHLAAVQRQEPDHGLE